MEFRRLPLQPNLRYLKHEARDLLRDIRRGDPAAVAELRHYHPEAGNPADAKLADAQLVLARSYQASSWPRLVQACELVDAIWKDDLATVRDLVTKHPNLLHEEALIRTTSNWGPPMTFAANVGRDRIIDLLHELGAQDLESAIGRAVLQGKIPTARKLHDWLGRPVPPEDMLGGPAYTLSVSGTALLFELGAKVYAPDGRRLAPVDVVLFSDSRKPAAKHAILEMYAKHGFAFPDTPTMALHRGRLDLLEAHLRRDPGLLSRTFTHAEIFPPELGCGDWVDTQGTPLEGSTLLHQCVDFDEVDIARWLLERGMDPDAKATVDAEGFGGHTALFGAAVSYANFWANYDNYGPPSRADDGAFARMLLDHGANPNTRVSLVKRGKKPHEVYAHRDATPLSWGEQFPIKLLVSKRSLRLIAERGGQR